MFPVLTSIQLRRRQGRNEPLVGSTTWKTLRAYIENWIQRRETVLMLESAGGSFGVFIGSGPLRLTNLCHRTPMNLPRLATGKGRRRPFALSSRIRNRSFGPPTQGYLGEGSTVAGIMVRKIMIGAVFLVWLKRSLRLFGENARVLLHHTTRRSKLDASSEAGGRDILDTIRSSYSTPWRR